MSTHLPPAPATIDKTEIEPLSALRHTLAESILRGLGWPNYDQDLCRNFSDDPKDANVPAATRFPLRVRPLLHDVLRRVPAFMPML
jgi:hypothetical protein